MWFYHVTVGIFVLVYSNYWSHQYTLVFSPTMSSNIILSDFSCATLEPSHTLQTPSPTIPKKCECKRMPEHWSEITTARWSQRVCRKTEHAMGDKFKRYMRMYQWEDKQACKSVQSKKAPVIELDFCAFAAQVLPLSSDLENSNKGKIIPGTDSVSSDDPSNLNFKWFGPDKVEETLTNPPVRDHFDCDGVVASTVSTATEAPDDKSDPIRKGTMEPKEKTEDKELTHNEDPKKRPIITTVSDPTDLQIEELSMLSGKD